MTLLIRLFTFVVVIFGVLGCGSQPEREINDENLISQLQPISLPEKETISEPPSLGFVVEQYQLALDIATNDLVRHQILTRLAGLELLRSEAEQAKNEHPGPFYEKASAFYKELLDLDMPGLDNDELQYQLAKAYAMDGKKDLAFKELDSFSLTHTSSSFYTEVQFRRGEEFFSIGEYDSAQKAYLTVLEDKESPYYHYALYMHGWSVFKQGKQRESLYSFINVLDELLVGGASYDSIRKGHRTLVDDTLRVMSIVFSYEEGAETISEFFPPAQETHYVHLVYNHLSEFYLEQKRFRRGIDTLAAYARTYPLSNYSPLFAERRIIELEKSPFIDEIMPAKEEFVNQYGIHSEFWKVKGKAIQLDVARSLKPYLETLSQYYHAKAGDFKKSLAKHVNTEESKQNRRKVKLAYVVAAGWYEQFIDTFPFDEAVPHYSFLQAESLYEAEVWRRAIALYEKVAYQFADNPHRSKAGYAALLSYDQLIKLHKTSADLSPGTSAATKDFIEPEVQNRNSLLRNKISSAQRFFNHFPNHKEGLVVLLQAANELFSLKDYPLASKLANDVLNLTKPKATIKQQQSALLVKAHSEFELLNYVEAEKTYLRLLPLINKDKALTGKIREKIAASIYQQADELSRPLRTVVDVTPGQQRLLEQSIYHYLRIEQVVPSSPIRITAHYDAANLYMKLSNWRSAADQFVRFRVNYPKHELSRSIPSKLVHLYKEMSAYSLAANEMHLLYQREKDADIKREALLQIAELYELGENWSEAIKAYRLYANTYTFKKSYLYADLLLEAQFKLTEMYQRQNQVTKRRFWLRKLIALDKAMGDKRTDRSRTLAAQASLGFAEEAFIAFNKIKLSLPLKISLKKKKKAMTEALKLYKQVMEYGILDYTTTANYQIGLIYQVLSKDLIASDRPSNLDDLALEQYEILLEEQVYPFEEKAIEILEANTRRAWEGQYDSWVEKSFETLAELLPGRYAKNETVGEVNYEIH